MSVNPTPLYGLGWGYENTYCCFRWSQKHAYNAVRLINHLCAMLSWLKWAWHCLSHVSAQTHFPEACWEWQEKHHLYVRCLIRLLIWYFSYALVNINPHEMTIQPRGFWQDSHKGQSHGVFAANVSDMIQNVNCWNISLIVRISKEFWHQNKKEGSQLPYSYYFTTRIRFQ